VVAADDEAPAVPGLQPAEALLGSRQQPEHLLGVVDQLHSSLRQQRPLLPPEQQRSALPRLELPHGHADRRLAHPEPAGGTGEAAGGGDVVGGQVARQELRSEWTKTVTIAPESSGVCAFRDGSAQQAVPREALAFVYPHGRAPGSFRLTARSDATGHEGHLELTFVAK
jgi:hypothetical protein